MNPPHIDSQQVWMSTTLHLFASDQNQGCSMSFDATATRYSNKWTACRVCAVTGRIKCQLPAQLLRNYVLQAHVPPGWCSLGGRVAGQP